MLSEGAKISTRAGRPARGVAGRDRSRPGAASPEPLRPAPRATIGSPRHASRETHALSDQQDFTTIYRIARVAGRLGMNETRVRWKLLRWAEQRQARRDRVGTAVAHVSYEHAVCGQCGRVLPRGTRDCPTCGARLEPRIVQMLRRAGMHSPVVLSAGSFLVAIILVAFARQTVATGFSLWGGGSIEEIVRMGAHVPAFEHAGQWWRLGTAVLLHAGLIHALFNLFAMVQIAPFVEDAYGPGRTVFFFFALGILANVPTSALEKNMIGVGASGAIMGLIGVAAGWGQREGTTHGTAVRNMMLKWLLYVTLFGLFLRADHSAHIAGFVAGAAAGWIFHGVKRRVGATDAVLGAIGVLGCLALLALVLFPPGFPRGYAW